MLSGFAILCSGSREISFKNSRIEGLDQAEAKNPVLTGIMLQGS
jgi:hypothetical protein